MAVSAWVPSGAMGELMPHGDDARDSRGAPMFRLMGRLAPARTLGDARAEIDVVVNRLLAAYPKEHKGTRALVIPENRARPDPSVAEFLPVIAAVFVAMVALILVIACANVANLMIARGLARQRDLVIRSALGASRFRLIRLQAMEGLVLAGVAAVVALVLANWAGRALATFTPTGDMPVNVESGAPDWRFYAFTFVVAIAAGLLTAWWPALQASRFNLVESLKEGSAAAGSRRHFLRNVLVVGQVALSLVVLAGGGLFVHSLQQMQNLGVRVPAEGPAPRVDGPRDAAVRRRARAAVRRGADRARRGDARRHRRHGGRPRAARLRHPDARRPDRRSDPGHARTTCSRLPTTWWRRGSSRPSAGACSRAAR